MNENEFEFTRNVSARKITSDKSEDIAGFATGSNFKPYITTIGLYDEHSRMLAVGKMAQPIQKTDDVDMNFIVRWDY